VECVLRVVNVKLIVWLFCRYIYFCYFVFRKNQVFLFINNYYSSPLRPDNQCNITLHLI